MTVVYSGAMSMVIALTAVLLGAPPVTAAAPKPPEVSTSEHVKEHMGKTVAVLGQVERVPVAKGKGEWQGTAVVLDDDTTIYVTYDEPPKGWEGLIGARVRVEGLLSPSIDDHSQSLLAPHLRTPGAPVKEARKLGSLLNKRVRLSGLARDAKGGAVLLINDEPIYLAGLESWPSGADQKLVGVGGTLVVKQYLPEATRNAKGEVSQGAFGKQTVLENPVWRVISAEPKP